jgi:hypothetical protein
VKLPSSPVHLLYDEYTDGDTGYIRHLQGTHCCLILSFQSCNLGFQCEDVTLTLLVALAVVIGELSTKSLSSSCLVSALSMCLGGYGDVAVVVSVFQGLDVSVEWRIVRTARHISDKQLGKRV